MVVLTTAELYAQGKALRAKTPRSAPGTGFNVARDPVAILEAQNPARLQELVPVRWGRMVQTPFTFYRGAAALMAHDLSTTPVSGIRVQACGDAHLSNFGWFASPERSLVFDLNDFDETLPAPWEWDVERLAASFAVAARNAHFGQAVERSAAKAVCKGYRRRIREAAAESALDTYHAVLTAERLRQASAARKKGRKERDKKIERTLRKARRRTSEQAMGRLTAPDENGDLRIVNDPPLIVRFEEPPTDVVQVLHEYQDTVPADVCELLKRFGIVDAALKVVGVGSVGTRCFIVLCLDSGGHPLILQVKEATASVLEPYAGQGQYSHMGERVVAGQRIMQAISDPMLGWTEAGGRHYYVRHFRDMKGSFEVEGMSGSLLLDYARLCGTVLARAHAESCEPALIAGYLGKGKDFAAAMADFAVRYADQNDRDHQALTEAIASGRITADTEG